MHPYIPNCCCCGCCWFWCLVVEVVPAISAMRYSDQLSNPRGWLSWLSWPSPFGPCGFHSRPIWPLCRFVKGLCCVVLWLLCYIVDCGGLWRGAVDSKRDLQIVSLDAQYPTLAAFSCIGQMYLQFQKIHFLIWIKIHLNILENTHCCSMLADLSDRVVSVGASDLHPGLPSLVLCLCLCLFFLVFLFVCVIVMDSGRLRSPSGAAFSCIVSPIFPLLLVKDFQRFCLLWLSCQKGLIAIKHMFNHNMKCVLEFEMMLVWRFMLKGVGSN